MVSIAPQRPLVVGGRPLWGIVVVVVAPAITTPTVVDPATMTTTTTTTAIEVVVCVAVDTIGHRWRRCRGASLLRGSTGS
jgi:hypothetical protein